MTYAIFTKSEKVFRDYCSLVFGRGIYAGFDTLPMLIWNRKRVVLRDGTDIVWINTSNDFEDEIRGRKFQRIYVVDGVSKLQLLESVYSHWNPQ